MEDDKWDSLNICKSNIHSKSEIAKLLSTQRGPFYNLITIEVVKS